VEIAIAGAAYAMRCGCYATPGVSLEALFVRGQREVVVEGLKKVSEKHEHFGTSLLGAFAIAKKMGGKLLLARSNRARREKSGERTDEFQKDRFLSTTDSWRRKSLERENNQQPSRRVNDPQPNGIRIVRRKFMKGGGRPGEQKHKTTEFYSK
jgi:hypothetical protein